MINNDNNLKDVPRARVVSRVARREGEHARPPGGAPARRHARRRIRR